MAGHIVKVKKVSKKECLWIILLLSFFESPFLAQYKEFDFLYNLIKFLCVGYLAIHVRKILINRMVILIVGSQFITLVSTYRHGFYATPAVEMVSIVAFSLFVSNIFQDDAVKSIDCIYLVIELLIYINVLTVFLFPHGLYDPLNLDYERVRKYYFLGHQNSMEIYMIIGITLGRLRLALGERDYSRRRFMLLLALCCIYAFKVWSVLSILCTVAITLFVAIEHIKKRTVRIRLEWVFIINIFLFILFVVNQNMSILNTFLRIVFKRSATFSGRTRIWKVAFNIFLRHPVLGIGKGRGKALFGYATCHNRYLNVMYTSGLLGLLIFLLMLFLVMYRLRDGRKQFTYIFIEYFAILIFAMQGETYEMVVFYVGFLLVYDIRKLRLATGGQRSAEIY